MKGIVKVFAITSILVLIGAGVLAFFANKKATEIKREQKALQDRQLDKPVYGVKRENIATDMIIPLFLSGPSKNVNTFTHDKVDDIYDVAKSQGVEDSLHKITSTKNAGFDKPIWAYNPYGTDAQSMYVYFTTDKEYYLNYTIHIENSDIPDFRRSAIIDETREVTRTHEYMLRGLIPGVDNYIIMELVDAKGELYKREVFRVSIPKIDKGADTQLVVKDGQSMEQESFGLFFGIGYKSKGTRKGIYIYDNSGYLRGSIPAKNTTTNMMFYNNNLFFNYTPRNIVAINPMGKVVANYKITGYKISQDFRYDAFGHILAIATADGAKSIQDRVISINIKNGGVQELLNMSKLMGDVRKHAKGKKKWIMLNSVIISGSSTLILSSQELSSIIIVDNVGSKLPVVSGILSQPEIWSGTKYSECVYSQTELSEGEDGGGGQGDATGEEGYAVAGLFTSHLRPGDLHLTRDESLTEDQFYLSLYNTNNAYSATRKDLNLASYQMMGSNGVVPGHSYEYTYLVDREAKTYALTKQNELPYTTQCGNVFGFGEHFVVYTEGENSFSERDAKNISIQSYTLDSKASMKKVYKYDMKGIWFTEPK